jgi:hypothetical protein
LHKWKLVTSGDDCELIIDSKRATDKSSKHYFFYWFWLKIWIIVVVPMQWIPILCGVASCRDWSILYIFGSSNHSIRDEDKRRLRCPSILQVIYQIKIYHIFLFYEVYIDPSNSTSYISTPLINQFQHKSASQHPLY